jgi:hypothetical protein
MTEEIVIMTPQEMAVAQNSGDYPNLDEIIQALARIIELRILGAGYIPYQDHPSCAHPKDNVSMIEVSSIRSDYLPYLREIFKPKGWELLDGSPWTKDCIVVRVAQTLRQRKQWIVEQMQEAGHGLKPWQHPNDPTRRDQTYCTNKDCKIRVMFDPIGTTKYPLGEGVWASEFMQCPAASSHKD